MGVNGRPTHAWYPPVYRGPLPPAVQLATRGQPDALSGAVPGVSPRSRPRARTGDGGAGKGRGRKQRPSCHGRDRGSTPCAERRPTSRGCDRMRSTWHTVNRGSVDHASSCTTSVLGPGIPGRAPDQLGRLSSPGAVPATTYRPSGSARRVAQGQTPDLAVGPRVCRARFSRQAGDRDYGQEDARGGWGPLGDRREERACGRAHWPMARRSAGTPDTALSPQEKRPAAPAVDPDPDRPSPTGGLSAGTAADRRNHGRSALLRVSAHASRRRCHRPVFQDPAAATLCHLDL